MPELESPAALLRTALSQLRVTNYYDVPDRDGELHRNVCAAVNELKQAGMTPEQVILAVKRIAIEANVGLAGVPVVAAMVKWCLEHYFKE